jgi:hypothetical protein
LRRRWTHLSWTCSRARVGDNGREQHPRRIGDSKRRRHRRHLWVNRIERINRIERTEPLERIKRTEPLERIERSGIADGVNASDVQRKHCLANQQTYATRQ